MSLQEFLICLLAVSILTGLVTEGIKNTLTEWGKTYQANTLAGCVATVLGILTGVGYCVVMDVTLNGKLIVMLVALVLLGWLCAMVGYDKVIQAIQQFLTAHKGEVGASAEQQDQTRQEQANGQTGNS